MVLKSIGIEVEFPIISYCDSVGAFFMSENASATARKKYMDERYHYVREFVVEGFIRIVFVRLEDDKLDMFTTNVSTSLYH
jgi:hypothetical protein